MSSVEDIADSLVYAPDKHCMICPMCDQSISWCHWYRRKVNEYEPTCRIKRVCIELWREDYNE